ncbi:MAG: hypothetical protein JSS64_07200 [Bacteroidetes bacterium]|nr:hypothetical protein [Bacteroidota bacterium]
MERHGYNDLKMRKDHLCLLMHTICRGGSVAVAILSEISFHPFPINGH